MARTLHLDFTRGRLDPRIQFSRSGTATYFNASGVLTSAASGEPRFDHDPATGESLGLLIEEQRTNIVLQSDDRLNAAWSQTFINGSGGNFWTVTSDATVGTPYGAGSAGKYVATATGSTLFARQNITIATTTTYAASQFIYVPTQAGITSFKLFVNVNDADPVTSESITTFDRWIRVTDLVFTTTAPRTVLDFEFYANGSGLAPASGVTFYATGFQLEAGAFATSYIPTTSAAVTRNADVASMTGANFSSWYRQDEGTFVCNARIPAGPGAFSRVWQADDGTTSERMMVLNSAAGNRRIYAVLTDGGSGLVDTSTSANDAVLGQTFRTSYAYKLNDIAFAFDSNAITTDTTATMPTVDRLTLGSALGSTFLNGHISIIDYHNERLPNWMLQALSSYAGDTVNPSLELNFSRTKRLDPRITFSRASTGTYFNASGVLTSAASGEPRFDHDLSIGESLGLLIEEQRANLLTYSEQFDNAAWTKTRSSITANAVAAPDGTTTADKSVEDSTATNTHSTNLTTSSLTSGTAYTISIFAKAAERSVLSIAVGGAAYTVGQTYAFTLSGAGTVTNLGGTSTASITSIGNGWYRCSMTSTAQATGTALLVFYLANAATGAGLIYSGDGTSGLYIWGAQLEAGAFPTSYIPTVAAAVTRNADVASMTGTNFSSWYNQTEGTFVARVRQSSAVSSAALTANNTASGTNNRIALFASNVFTDLLHVVVGGVVQVNFLAANSVSAANTSHSCAAVYKVNDFAISQSGTTSATDTSGTLPAVDRLEIGSQISGSFLNGHISRISFYPVRLNNSTLQALST